MGGWKGCEPSVGSVCFRSGSTSTTRIDQLGTRTHLCLDAAALVINLLFLLGVSTRQSHNQHSRGKTSGTCSGFLQELNRISSVRPDCITGRRLKREAGGAVCRATLPQTPHK